ncbi:hypothetical protein LTR85_001901 [Meristemomyces frigidus]|nr:hypothetical protein LTR85_001901 [Meristemomyces frigidus]
MDKSSFGKLAPELRNRIYELALSSADPFHLYMSRTHSRLQQQPKTAQRYPLALAATCRAIRAEATALFYGSNTFIFRACPMLSDSDHQLLQDFRSQIGEANATALRTVVFDAGWCTNIITLRCLLSNLQIASARDATRCRIKVKARFLCGIDVVGEKPIHYSIPLELDVGDITAAFGIARRDLEARLSAASPGQEADNLRRVYGRWEKLEMPLQAVGSQPQSPI